MSRSAGSHFSTLTAGTAYLLWPWIMIPYHFSSDTQETDFKILLYIQLYVFDVRTERFLGIFVISIVRSKSV